MRYAIAAALFLMTLARAQADRDLFGRDRFPQFRGLSGLAGSGFGVDPQGKASLSGATALSTPIAYVLGHGQFRLGYSVLSDEDRLNLSFKRSNGTGMIMYGHSFAGWNVAISDLFLSSTADQAFNLQAQYVPPAPSNVSFSAGVQDIEGKGGSSGRDFPGDDRLSRSFFLVATVQATEGENPLFFSAGFGTRRFQNGFASASIRVAGPLRLWTEWDGLGWNAGGLLSFLSGNPERPAEFSFLFGVVKSNHPILGAVVGF